MKTDIGNGSSHRLSPCSWTILIFLLYGASANAELLSRVSVSSNYLWRGVTQTDDQPAVAFGLEYQHAQGAYVGAWATNTRYGGKPGYEFDLYLGRLIELELAIVDLGLRHYAFPTGGKHDYDFHREAWENEASSAFTELQLGVSRKQWEARYAYSTDYLDSGHHGHYIELNHIQSLYDNLSLKLHIGVQHSRAIDDKPEHQLGDYSATLRWKELFLTWSNLTDNTDGRQSDEARIVFGWSTVICC